MSDGPLLRTDHDRCRCSRPEAVLVRLAQLRHAQVGGVQERQPRCGRVVAVLEIRRLETFTVSLTVMLLTLAICRSITQSGGEQTPGVAGHRAVQRRYVEAAHRYADPEGDRGLHDPDDPELPVAGQVVDDLHGGGRVGSEL